MSGFSYPVQCTAGAIPYKNEKGEMSMKNVKVSRYVAGKAPEFVNMEIDEEIEDEIQEPVELIRDAFPDRNSLINKKGENVDVDMEESFAEQEMTEKDMEDKRIQRLMKGRRRMDVEILEDSDSDNEIDKVARHLRERQSELQREGEGSEEEEENEEDEEEIRTKRNLLKMRALANVEEDVPVFVEMDDDEEEEEIACSDVDESDSDVEKEPKLKPVFVRAAARHTIHKTKEQIQKEQEKERLKIKHDEEMVKQRRKLIEKVNKEEAEEGRITEHACDTISSDIENEGEAFETWKMRELKRIKRDREEQEHRRHEKEDVQRVRNMTEEQRLHEFKVNPKKIINQQPQGKLKYMQKYYHRGAYFVQEMDDEVFKRDFTAPTLEDNFNIQNLPLVKQVKNFGRAGRTKYTHLVDQDTTDFESGWANSNSTLKFYNSKGGGTKQVFEKPRQSKKN